MHVPQCGNVKYIKTIINKFDDDQRTNFENSYLGFLANMNVPLVTIIPCVDDDAITTKKRLGTHLRAYNNNEDTVHHGE